MSEQEARSTIETYENTFGKELRRRTFRTWNDWAKAEEEFTPKDGSLQYVNQNSFFRFRNDLSFFYSFRRTQIMKQHLLTIINRKNLRLARQH